MCKLQMERTYNNKEAVNYSTEWSTKVNKPRIFTVWQKSSMGFQGTYGFSVYDASGGLVYRVDNYSRRQKYLTKEIVLMDGNGKGLLCLRPRIMSMRDRWNAYGIEECRNKEHGTKLFSMRRYSMLQKTDKAAVSVTKLTDTNKLKLVPGFRIEGCFEKRNCKIYNRDGQEIARVSRKTVGESPVLLANDVYTLVIQPGYDSTMVMAFVIIMDRLH